MEIKQRLPVVAKSPDINPIEHVWELIGHRINRYAMSLLCDFKLEIQNTWYFIKKEVCENLFDRMERRLQTVLTSNGGVTKY